ncbi:unnamed protein product [Aspergillus oryzae]|nr:unnamed protein product [Aspergillus oryzae]GMF94010.1 unnamed protein product [Aspergillus oryzae]
MVLEAHTYLRDNPGVNMRDFAYTLQHRRSTLPYRTAVAAPNTQDAIDTLASVGLEDSGVRHGTSRQPPRILGIFTGQGAQWPRMGARLIETSPFIVTRIAELDAALQSLPNPDHRPGWTIHDQIVASPESSRLTEAAVSQPLCLAVQIIIVDILRAAGISLCGVVGHSSGEIGAAYAAGFLSATDAIRIAYLRGMHANKAASPNSRVSCGAMIAVGIPAAEAKRFCKAQFAGRLEIAAENCASSVTLSGDEDAALEAIQFFHMQGVFARLLKINTAYHSCHMAPCASPYLASLDACGIEPCQQGNTKHPVWFSTVFEGQTMTASSVANQYWVDNMCKPVLFAGGLARAVEQIGPFDLVIEIGPHPALKGPASSLLNCAREMPYISLLRRGTDDVHALCSALGYIWAQLGPNSVQFAEVDMLLSSTTRSPVMLSDLPPYPFDHGRNYWHHSRLSDHFRPRTQIHLSNPILGFRCLEAATPGSFQWRNILQPTEIGWLSGHQLQGQIVFPAMGYVSMSVEAIQLVLADIRPNDSIRLFRLTDLEISRAIVFNTDDAAIETIFSLFLIAKTEYSVRAEWRCYSSTSSSSMTLNAKGCVSAQFGSPSAEALPFKTTESFGLVSVKDADFYSNLSHLGYNYAPPFRGVSSIRRKPKYSVSTVVDQSASRWEDNLTLHPGMLDSALQTIFAAWSYPGDTQLWSLHAPVSVASIVINPYFSALGPGGKQRYLCSETLIHWKKPTDVLADVAMRTADAEYAFLEFDGVKLIPISPAASEDDRAIFSRFKYASAVPDTQLVSTSGRLLMPRDGCPLSRDTGEFDLVGSPSKRVSACPIDDCAGRIVLAISHRYPQADICEICGETGATPSAVLKALDGRYGSYTFTDVSCDFAKSAKERFHRETRPMSFKAFDVERDPQSQGFPECSYDVIIALNIRSGLGGVGGPLSNIRRLLKPGGFLIASGGTSVKSPAVEMAAIGTMSEWSSGTRSARSGGPLLTLAQWDTVLKMTGFSGIDTASTEIKASQRADIIVSQAVDYRISWLRDPLSFEQMPPGVRIGTLAIIGGATWPVHKLVQDILKLVAGRFRDTLAFDTIEEYAVSELARSVAGPGGVSILSLTDLDRPYLEEMTGEKFEALKACTSARTLLWVTCGSLEDRPYSYMMTGITRTIKSENPAMHVQMYDLDPNLASCIQPTTAVDLANSLLQQITLHSWGNDASLLWTAEPEVYIRDGRQLIPRLVPDHEKNDRYNSQYKSLLTTVDPSNARLELAAGDGGMLELRQLSPLQLLPGPSTECRTLRVTHSVLQAVFVGSAGFLRVCIGIDMSAGETVLALSTCETSPTRVPAPWCIPFATPPTPVALVDVAANLIATRIFSFTCWNGALMIYGSDAALQRAIQSRASDNNVHVVFTTTNACQKHMQSPLSVRGKPTVPNNTTLFVNFVEGVIPEVVECLPPACLRLDKAALVSHTAEKEVDAAEIAHVSDLLQQAVSSIPSTSLSMECIPLSEASSCDPLQKPLSVVDWNATAAVSARVQPIDTGTLFRADRTYLFVGMASELGQSLAGWMIAHGARHIVLSSRTPKLQPKFVEEMHDKYSANVTAIALDITSRTSLYSVHAMIQATLPPIAGILNGAMVLQDALFTSMTHEQFDAATMPKVQGTVLLDELFYSDTSLDFFIVASSISSVIGWSGQANYSAANQFMTALVTQRRNRGVAGSTMNIPAILGIGHAARSGTFDFAYFQSLGHVNIGEEDLHTLFAEAILSGRPCPLRASYGTTQVVMGIDYITAAANLNSPLTHRRDVKFAHFITPDTQAGRAHLANEAHPTKQLRVQLQSHIPREPTTTYTVVCNSFVKHLKRVLRLPPDHLIDESIPLNEQGVDSLVAMDIRAWFLSELEVDSPTLLIMGGGSVSDLVWMAVERVHGDDREECASGDQTGFSNKLSTPSPRSPSSLERGSEK